MFMTPENKVDLYIINEKIISIFGPCEPLRYFQKSRLMFSRDLENGPNSPPPR